MFCGARKEVKMERRNLGRIYIVITGRAHKKRCKNSNVV
jgi:hypothetical protein